ncbi:PD40 domain-containing protein [Candidatus Woesearchaeota archaeon]|nr:PD40 domain-containing protein [Candidatus Woesearchaeota archaeon]
MGLEEKIREETGSFRYFDRFWKKKWLKRTILPFATILSLFLSERKIEAQNSLNHDPILLIHGLDTRLVNVDNEYCDFNGNRFVGFEDFIEFGKRFGAKKGDAKYDEGYDLDRNDAIGFGDFIIFNRNFGKFVDPLESTWDEFSKALKDDLKLEDGGIIGRWVPANFTKADFYKLRLTSGDNLTFDQQGEELKFAVDQINKVTGKKIILVGFSMGGLAARAYLQNEFNPKSSALVTVCTPHVGSYLAYLSENDKPKISEWRSKWKEKGFWVEQAAELFVSVAGINKPAIKYLAPGSDSLKILNNNIHKMPEDIQYVNVVSEIPNLEALDWYLELINRYALDYEKNKDSAASIGLLTRGDGVVPTISQLLSYAIVNTNSNNAKWYKEAKKDITENSEMQVSHLDGNKQSSILTKILKEVADNTIFSLEGKIVSSYGGKIWYVNPSGSNRRHLSTPAWTFSVSPSSSRIAYQYDKGIQLADIDGSNIQQLSEDGSYPCWSPNEKNVAFLRNLDKGRDIFSIDISTKTITRLTYLEGDVRNPSWHPSDNILFSSNKTGTFEIYSLDPKSMEITQLTSDRENSRHFPSSSFDRKSTVYIDWKYWDPGPFVDPISDLAIIILDNSTGKTTKLDIKGNNYYPHFSPDGSKIVFSKYIEREKEYFLHTINVDGNPLTNMNVTGKYPVWIPNKE